MKVIMFKPRFAALVESGIKRQTVRPWQKRPPNIGTTLSLRKWTGLPYRSKQEVIKTVTCSDLCGVEIMESKLAIEKLSGEMTVLRTHTDQPAMDSFARDDGFGSWGERWKWFHEEHDDWIFFGHLISWK